ncbi:MAG: diacylglycerol/lipid kinase family protein [Dissulfurispiraceae bacterium]
MIDNILLIGNPVAGRNALRKIERAEKIIRERGFGIKVLLTARQGDAERLARDAANKPYKVVIAAGGDGTYNEVANGLACSTTPMAILPLGTTSVLAHELQMSHDLKSSVDIALTGAVQSIHLGRITLTGQSALEEAQKKDPEALSHEDHSSSITSRYFLLMAGIGFDGETVLRTSEWLKRYAGKGAYILSGLKTFLSYDPSLISIEADLGTGSGAPGLAAEPLPSSQKVAGYFAVVGKASCYGGEYQITPGARLNLPYFYVFVTHKKGRWNFLRYAGGVFMATHVRFRDVSYFQATSVTLKGRAHVQIDGDYFGTTPARIEIVTDALKIMVSGSPR